ncbi:uncharacterized protein LOC118241542 [Electrophorus electricus]|uniref:uncharacterized protein LOC118241542 n=1 Tax=Electrophorus electricus TaxID=8005 RepID=UPI0015CFEB76|nr:uncharacterized protein LOC118241542 [Electrophorus electricus]
MTPTQLRARRKDPHTAPGAEERPPHSCGRGGMTPTQLRAQRKDPHTAPGAEERPPHSSRRGGKTPTQLRARRNLPLAGQSTVFTPQKASTSPDGRPGAGTISERSRGAQNQGRTRAVNTLKTRSNVSSSPTHGALKDYHSVTSTQPHTKPLDFLSVKKRCRKLCGENVKDVPGGGLVCPSRGRHHAPLSLEKVCPKTFNFTLQHNETR